MKNMIAEVLVESASEVRTVQYMGAHALLLVRRAAEGGLSPELKVLDAVFEVSRLPVTVLVKPDFQGFEHEGDRRNKLLAHLRAYRQAGVQQVALTATSHGALDVPLLEEVLSFGFRLHFQELDALRQPLKALQFLNMYPKVLQVVTRGQQKSCWEGRAELLQLMQASKPPFRVLADSTGLSQHQFHELVHSTPLQGIQFGKWVRTNDGRLDAVVLEHLLEQCQRSGGRH